MGGVDIHEVTAAHRYRAGTDLVMCVINGLPECAGHFVEPYENPSILPVTAFSQNCSSICVLKPIRPRFVDPGGEAEKTDTTEVSAKGVLVTQILLTHGHLDHVGAAAQLAEHYQVPVIGPRRDQFQPMALPTGQMFGLDHCDPLTPDTWLEEGEARASVRKPCQYWVLSQV